MGMSGTWQARSLPTVEAVNELACWACSIFGALVAFDNEQSVTWPFKIHRPFPDLPDYCVSFSKSFIFICDTAIATTHGRRMNFGVGKGDMEKRDVEYTVDTQKSGRLPYEVPALKTSISRNWFPSRHF